MYEFNINQLIKPYLGKTIEKRDRKTSIILLNNLEKLPFFRMIVRNHHNLWRLMHTNIISLLVFKEFEPEQQIFNYGEDISGMYLIIDGKVNIYHIKKDTEKKINNKKNNNIENEIEDKLCFSYQLSRGYAIGDKCLKYEKRHLNFSASAASKCILGFLSKENYLKIFSKANSVESNIITGFLLGLCYFTESCITKRSENFVHKKFYEKDSYIFKQDSPYKTFYIIYKGTINISVNLKKTVKCLVDQNFLLGDNTNTDRFTSLRDHELKGNYKENKNYNIVNYEHGEVIGGIELMKNINKYLYSAKCASDVELIKFNIKDIRQMNKIKASENFKKKINEQLNFFKKRIDNINNNLTKSYIASKPNKFVKAFIENHKSKKKNKYFHNVFENKIKIYRPKNFLKMNMRPLSADFKNTVKYNKKKIIQSYPIKNSTIINRNKLKRPISPEYNIYNKRNNNILKLRKNYTEIQQKSKSFNKKNILNLEKIKKNLSNHDNSITTNIGTKSSYILTDRYNSECYNSLSTNFYYNSSKPKEKKNLNINRIDKFKKFLMNKSKEKNSKYTRINLFKEDKRNKKINMKHCDVKKLFIIRDECNDKNTVSTILRNMFFSPQNKTHKSLY